MISKSKIINDPVYGFITIPFGIIFDLIEHPYFQRLRRIKQLGLTHYVYPGALHTRFHHALGAYHLMQQAIETLRGKGVEITEEEARGVSIAILLHDIGHGPFSHALEHSIVNVHHEELSVQFMEELNATFKGQLDLAIAIFKNEYPKRFLYQLVSGQLDMDRMDYLNRDSFYTGVSEGVIGYHRIIKMLQVVDDDLVVEEKGIYSIEKFLIARRIMYWQVYLHKTALAAEQMLIKTLERTKELALRGNTLNVSESLAFFLYRETSKEDFIKDRKNLIDHYSRLDDVDVVAALKNFVSHEDKVLSFLAHSLVNRKLFKIELKNSAPESDHIKKLRLKTEINFQIKGKDLDYLVFRGKEVNRAYNIFQDEIKILFKNGSIKPVSAISELGIRSRKVTKYYLCYPKSTS